MATSRARTARGGSVGGAPSDGVAPRATSRPAAEPAFILIAIPDPDRAGRIAMACAERNLLATLAFTPEQVGRRRRATRFDLVLLGLVSRNRVGSIVTAAQRFGDPIVVLLDREELPNPVLAELGVLAGIDVQAGDGEIAARVSALLSLQRRGPLDRPDPVGSARARRPPPRRALVGRGRRPHPDPVQVARRPRARAGRRHVARPARRAGVGPGADRRRRTGRRPHPPHPQQARARPVAPGLPAHLPG